MPLRERDGNWHYRFWLDGREYTANTDLVATERNRNGAMRIEAKARELVKNGRAQELKLLVRPFNEAGGEFLRWADGEYRDHPNSAKRLRTSFVSLSKFFGKAPVSSILRGYVNDFKSWRRTEHKVRGITFVTICTPFPRRSAISSTITGHARTQSAAWRSRATKMRSGSTCSHLSRKPFTSKLRGSGDGKSRAARRQLKLTGESREICTRRVMAAPSRWLFPGKLPGTRLAKLNRPHGRILDDLAVCKCTHHKIGHQKGKCPCGCADFREVSRLGFVIYDLRHTFATRAAEAGMPVSTLAAILGHADLRSVMKYVHVRQEAQDRAMDDFEAQNIQDEKRSSGFRPVDAGENRVFAGSAGTPKKGANARKIN